MVALQVVFWVACSLIVYAYVGYPILLGILSRLWLKRKTVGGNSPQLQNWPKVSLIIAAYKEQALILQRIQNALQMDYPADRLEILIGVDGCEDLTGELVRTVDDSRVHLHQFAQRRGKPSVLNDCVAVATGELIAFSDANTFWERDALKLLVSHFQNENVGGVCGQLILTDAATGKNTDGLYWKYENCLKRWEGQIGALLGFNGAIYAIRSSLWEMIPPQTIVDDFLIGMRIYQRRQSLVFEERAVANEETAPSPQAEFQRRTRIGAGGFQSLCWLSSLLSPRFGQVAFAFWSHKVLRWGCPLFMIIALLANVALASSGSVLYCGLLAAQVAFYGIALLGHFMPGNAVSAKLVRLTSLFVSMNMALAVGFWRWAGKRQQGTWTRTERSQEQVAQSPEPLSDHAARNARQHSPVSST